MYLVVGLGNPGPEYAGHRHNVGFMVVDRLAQKLGAGAFREKFSGLFTKHALGSSEVVLFKPMTYMNLSGECLQKALHFFKLGLDHVVVVHDELDLTFGTVRVKVGGGSAGHNGLKSIMQHCGSDAFARVRIGIDRPRSGRVEGWVLSDFSVHEKPLLDDVLATATAATEEITLRGAQSAMNRYNTPPKPD